MITYIYRLVYIFIYIERELIIFMIIFIYFHYFNISIVMYLKYQVRPLLEFLI